MDKFNVFKKGSTTYYTSSLFFPLEKRRDVASLYAFVRIADDFVDNTPQDTEGFNAFKRDYLSASNQNSAVIDFKRIEKLYAFDPEWAGAFLNSMEMDLHTERYQTLQDLETYLYGSAEVIGLCMNRILGIPNAADTYARYLGKAMQLINFIRDIHEDIGFGRIYFPQEDLQRFNIKPEDYLRKNVDQASMSKLIRFEIDRYLDWQTQAEKGYAQIPRLYRIAIKTAGDMYKWTAAQIYENPSIIFKKKLKPTKWYILFTGIKNIITA